MFSDLISKLFGGSTLNHVVVAEDTQDLNNLLLSHEPSPSTPNHNLTQRQKMQHALRSDVSEVETPRRISSESQVSRQTGSIRKLLATYGFIAGDDGVDYFLHWSGMDRRSLDFRRLEVQQRVSFQTVTGDRGLRAVSVFVLDDE